MNRQSPIDRSALFDAVRRGRTLSPSGLARTLGIRIVEYDADRVAGEMRADASHTTFSGDRVHGGALMAFADTLGAVGTLLNMPSGAYTATIESKTNFFGAGSTGRLKGVAVPLHRGRTTMVWETSIHDPSGRRIALVTQTQLVFGTTAASRPTEPAARRRARGGTAG